MLEGLAVLEEQVEKAVLEEQEVPGGLGVLGVPAGPEELEEKAVLEEQEAQDLLLQIPAKPKKM